ncbi:hypothetical protein Tsubulata_042303 [Turnera subulata]|uniref:Nuclear nucleic acid-binding protein C1D n=1 Tax=Turnera subulata TaxID=218843 RepID=A0A9Q0FYD0_9ROSI|nr:hypothetical protein Tsubulata_042303 [Turnera subulata]
MESSSSSVVPESAVEAVTRTLANVEQVQSHLLEFLSLADDPDVLTEIPPLQRAQSLFMLAKATTLLFALKLRCSGIDPAEHPVKTELERLSLYEDKLERSVDLSKAPLRPSTSLNYQAATRFIEHSLPDLTPEQRRSMRNISTGKGPSRSKHLETNSHKRRKYQSSEKPSVQKAAQEFLEKAARELFGGNTEGFKGPIQVDSSSEDELPVS